MRPAVTEVRWSSTWAGLARTTDLRNVEVPGESRPLAELPAELRIEAR
jgi:hypothetical protein